MAIALDGGGSPRGRDEVVCRVEELPPGERRLVPVGKFGVGVFNVKGKFYGLTNYCPHEGAPLCTGRIVGTTKASDRAVGGIEAIREGEIIRCPWHQWEFDLATGSTLAHPVRGIRTYPVRVVDGQVVLTV